MKLTNLILKANTTADNQAIGIIRLGNGIAGLAMIVLTLIAVLHGQPFDALEFGGAMAALFASTGGAISLKPKDKIPSG